MPGKLEFLMKFVPASARGVVQTVIAHVPIIVCSVEGHEPTTTPSGDRTAVKMREGMTALLCRRCRLYYSES